MFNIKTIAATHPKVGVQLPPDAKALRGQLDAIGFSLCDANDPTIDWLVTDANSAPQASVPVLRLPAKTSIFRLEKAIVALFTPQNQ